MHQGEMNDKTRMISELSGGFFPMMCTDMITHEVNRPDVRSNLLVQVFQKGDEFSLPFAFITLPIDVTRAGIKGGKEVEGAIACVLMLMPIEQVMGPPGAMRGKFTVSRRAEKTLATTRCHSRRKNDVFRNLYPHALGRAQQDTTALHARLMPVDGISKYLIKP
jgi:hypothetical protein